MITEFVNERFDSLKDPVGAGMSVSHGCGSTGGQGLLCRLSSLVWCLWEALRRFSCASIFRRLAEHSKGGIGGFIPAYLIRKSLHRRHVLAEPTVPVARPGISPGISLYCGFGHSN
jgi:hypothetical protein